MFMYFKEHTSRSTQVSSAVRRCVGAMGYDEGESMGTKAASCAFMSRLDLLTTAIYPHELPHEPQDTDDDPIFSLGSWAAVFPVLTGIGRLTVHMLRPYVAISLLVVAALGIAPGYCAAAGASILAYLCLYDKRFGEAVLGHLPLLPPGVHCRRSSRADAIVSMVPALQYPYYKGTPWIVGGDMATIYPFLAFHLPSVGYVRRWLTVDADDTLKNGGNHDFSRGKGVVADNFQNGFGYGSDSNNAFDASYEDGGGGGGNDDDSDGNGGAAEEAVALDVALPEAGLDPKKPFYIVLHGLNGGSAEPYVLDFTSHALKRGCGVCVMITRGCMGTPVRGESIFHGARISDVRSSVQALRKSLPAETPLTMVGYSMGAIVGANYCSISGDDSGIACCVSMSGSFDTRTNMVSQHSLRLWQPMLAMSLKENFVKTNVRKIAARGVDLSKIESCKNVLEFDIHMVAPYNGYQSVVDYYIDMSAAAEGKIAGLKTPLLAVSALDDPIMTATGAPIDDLEKIGDLFILLTRNGGHVGWPTGWLPTRNRWSWMSSTSLDFCEAVVATAFMKDD